MNFKVKFGPVEGALPVQMGTAIVVNGDPSPGAAEGYTRVFSLLDWTAFGTRWQMLVPAIQHKLGTAVVVVSVESQDADGYDNVLLNVRRLTNGDILLRADERFAGLVRLQKI